MKQCLTMFTLLFVWSTCFAQVDRMQVADSITEEGKRLYKSEMASWYGTDVFLEKFKSETENTGGYFSYPGKDKYTCVFFSKGDIPTVLGTISFIDSYDPAKASVDATKRAFTTQESAYYLIRKAAFEEIEKDTGLFRSYKNTDFNLIPLISETEKKVYVLTGTSIADIVIIGNDYLLRYDKDNKLISKKKLHANIIALNKKEEDKEGGQVYTGNVHNHLPETGSYMTATDICTFMLHERFTNWKQQTVISEKYMSIWNCETDKLIIIPTNR